MKNDQIDIFKGLDSDNVIMVNIEMLKRLLNELRDLKEYLMIRIYIMNLQEKSCKINS